METEDYNLDDFVVFDTLICRQKAIRRRLVRCVSDGGTPCGM